MKSVSQQSPAISVIVPVYKCEAFLPRCLHFILNQTFKDIEVIAINDHSPDRSLSILQDISKTDARLRIVDKERNEGVHAARADGIRESSGRYIAFSDSDDWYDLNMLQVLHSAATESEADIVICGTRLVDDNEKAYGLKVKLSRQTLDNESAFAGFCQMKLGTGALWNKLYKRHAIEPFGTADWGWVAAASEDTLVNLGCFDAAKKVVTIADVLYNYFIHPNNATQSGSNAKRFALHVRAYATAMEHYRHLPEERRALIDGLYRTQLKMPVYHVAHARELDEFESLLKEALQIILRERPRAIWELANLGLSCPEAQILHEGSFKKWVWTGRDTLRKIKHSLRSTK